MTALHRRGLLTLSAALLASRAFADTTVVPAPPNPFEAVSNEVGGYFTLKYGFGVAPIRAADAMSALAATAGLFAQLKARALIAGGVWKPRDGFFVEADTRDGRRFFFGDAISAGLLGSPTEGPGLWNYVSPAAKDPHIDAKIDSLEIVRHTAQTVGQADFGVPRVAAAYLPDERPLEALKLHAPVLANLLRSRGVPADQYTYVFGLAAQRMVAIVDGERSNFYVDQTIPALDAIRLFMEVAIPMSKIDPQSVGVIDPTEQATTAN